MAPPTTKPCISAWNVFTCGHVIKSKTQHHCETKRCGLAIRRKVEYKDTCAACHPTYARLAAVAKYKQRCKELDIEMAKAQRRRDRNAIGKIREHQLLALEDQAVELERVAKLRRYGEGVVEWPAVEWPTDVWPEICPGLQEPPYKPKASEELQVVVWSGRRAPKSSVDPSVSDEVD